VPVTDLLLVVILGLGVPRFLVPFFLPAFFDGLGPLAIAVALVFQSLCLAGAVRMVARRHGLGREDLGLRPATGAQLLHAAMMLPVVLLLVAVSNAGISALTGEPFDNPQIQAIAPALGGIGDLVVLVLFAGVLVPAIEEVAFRGLLQGWLRRRLSPVPAIGAGAFCFAVLHGIPLLIVPLFLVGLVLGWLYERDGSLLPPILLHAAFNAFTMTVLYLELTGDLAAALPFGAL